MLPDDNYYYFLFKFKLMRSVCMQFFEKRGIVYLKWKKCYKESNEKMIYWTSTIHRTFTKHIEPPGQIEVCLADKDYMNHIQNCPFKRVTDRTERFKIYPSILE
jgi:hypothetical protein